MSVHSQLCGVTNAKNVMCKIHIQQHFFHFLLFSHKNNLGDLNKDKKMLLKRHEISFSFT